MVQQGRDRAGVGTIQDQEMPDKDLSAHVS